MQQFIKSTPHPTRPFLMCAAVLDQTCSTKLVFIYSQILPGRQSQLAKRWRGSVGFQTSCPKVADFSSHVTGIKQSSDAMGVQTDSVRAHLQVPSMFICTCKLYFSACRSDSASSFVMPVLCSSSSKVHLIQPDHF